jgi:hypothetical protein
MLKCPKCKNKTLVISVFGSICSSCLWNPKDTGENLCYCGKILQPYKKDKYSFYCKDHPKYILSVG